MNSKTWTFVIVPGPGKPARQFIVTPKRLVAWMLTGTGLALLSLGLGWWIGTLEADHYSARLADPTAFDEH